MADVLAVVLVVVAYVVLLVLLASWAERQERRGRRVSSNAVVYSLSLAAYCTTWTFYGSVQLAATNGVLFLAIYLGPSLAAASWWWLLRKLVRIKDAHRVTSVADLLSVRYGKSQPVAMVATLALLFGLAPYVALQLKTMTTGVALLTGGDASRLRSMNGRLELGIALLMIGFTVAFGIRRLSPTERHPGMVVAVAAECVVKLVAFVAAGAFVTYGLFDGFGDVFRRAGAAAAKAPDLLGNASVVTWATHLVLSASAILFLPRQFHVAVVENADERHVRTARWLLPAYLLTITAFVLPIALGGLLLGHPAAIAETFPLLLPHAAGARWLSWLVFLGGFSAGTGMVVLETMALATMVSNHLVLPAVNLWPSLRPLRRHLLPVRWAAAAVVILGALAYERAFGHLDALVSIGLVSFAAVLQLAPALLIGLCWRGASTIGAIVGIGAGFAAWAYTLVLPLFVRAGWLPQRLLAEGPAGIAALRPEALLGVGGVDHLSHAVLWSMVVNVGGLVLGSVLFPASAAEEAQADRIVEALEPAAARQPVVGGSHLTDAAGARARIAGLFAQYRGRTQAEELADACLAKVDATPDGQLSALQFASLEAEVETTLASWIGTAAAHGALRTEGLATPAEARAISSAYRSLAQTVALLARSEARTRAVIESALDGIVVLRADGKVESLNPAAARMFGCDAAAAVGRDFLEDFVAPTSRAALAADLSRCRRGGPAGPAERPENHGLRADGQEFAVECNFAPVETDAGTGACAFVRDLSESKRLEMELNQARKLEAVGCLAAGIAHEINTPIQFIGDNVRFLEEAFTEMATALERGGAPATSAAAGDEDAEELAYLRTEVPRAIQRTLQGVQRVATIVRAMKEFAHPDQRDMVAADLNRSVEATLEVSRNEYKYVADVEADLGELPLVTCHPGELNQVLLNVVVNAAHAVGDVVKGTPQRGRIRVATRRDGAYAVVSISDTGGGIPEAIRHRVFDPFFTTKEVGRGTGQGLAIARTIVQKHRGSIDFETEPGKGTTFLIRIPIDAAPAPERSPVEA